ncbi:MAG: cytochrome c biogenesis protein CcsA [Ignavibacteria bacterium]|jgi:cytochrome c-type biogenesis protein CcmF
MIGNILLTLGLAAGVFTVVMYYLTYKGYENTLSLARIGYHAMTINVVAASAILLHAILTHQYQYKYVYNYSGNDLPTGLLMSTFYAGQEGSFMIWLFFTVIVGLILLEYTSKRGDLEQRVMMVFSLAAAFLLLMVNPMLKSPFTYLWTDPSYIDVKNINHSFLSMPFIQNFLFDDTGGGKTYVKISTEFAGILKSQGIAFNDFLIQGKGLNPLLQNFWMQIHPPILFVGFAMSTVPFSFAFAAILKNEYKDWVKQSMPWVLSGTMVLGLAIMLGGYWAYGVLGWGGYWGWDPVENASLVPWLIGVASIHTLLVQKKAQKKGPPRFVKTNLILCIMTYVLVLYSTFLTRSGILGDASVHSFVDPGMTVYLMLIVFVLVFALLGFGGIACRRKYLNDNYDYKENLLSRELALFTGAVTLIASGIIVLLGTSGPVLHMPINFLLIPLHILLKILFGIDLGFVPKTSVDIRFYNELNLPIAIIIGLLNGLSLMLKWKSTNGTEIWKSFKGSIIATVILSAVIIVAGSVYDVMLALLTISSVFTIIVNSEIAYRIFKGRVSYVGAYIAHVGIALFLLGAIATGGFTENRQVDLIKGQPKNVLGYDLTFTGYDLIEGGKKYAFNIDVEKGSSKSKAAPVMYIAEFNNSLMREPDILNKFTKDFYISPISYDETESGDTRSRSVTLNKGDSYNYKNTKILFTGFNFPENQMSSMMGGGAFEIGANLEIEYNGNKYNAEPKMVNQSGGRSFIAAEIPEANLKIDMSNLDASGKVTLEFLSLDGSGSTSAPEVNKEVLTIEASIKPYINLVWAGVLIMVLGFIISAYRRSKES